MDYRGFRKFFLILFETFDGQPHSYTIYSPLCNLKDQVLAWIIDLGKINTNMVQRRRLFCLSARWCVMCKAGGESGKWKETNGLSKV